MFGSFVTCALLSFFFLSVPTAYAVEEELPAQSVAQLSTLGRKPNWGELERYQRTITHDEFVRLLKQVYATRGYPAELIRIDPDSARILIEKQTQEYFVLHFAKSEAERLPDPHGWKMIGGLQKQPEDKPLAGLHIALDPGHLGGTWAHMEERWFKIGDGPPVQEGDMTLRVAQLLAPRLQSLGAKVSLLRDKAEPVTPYRPSDFETIARQLLLRAGVADPEENFNGPNDPEKEKTVAWQRELLFYRNSEIRRRATLVNYQVRPDLVICLHFNAEPWGDPANPRLIPDDHLHLLINGAYLPPELELEDERFEMLLKLLSGSFPEELGLAENLAGTLAKATGLPPYHYKTDNVTPIGTTGFVYARNLMATRLYRCPTVYLEPYVMNSNEVFERVKAGDYQGIRDVAGKKRQSIYREYVDAVVNGLLEYCKEAAP